MIVIVWPATLIVPDREGPLAAAMLIVTVPDPFPLAPAVMVIHGWLLDALQGQPLPAFTLIDRVPPVESTLMLSGDTSNEQPGDCVTVTSCPAIVAVPVRDGPVLDVIDRVTLAVPVPVAGATEIQLALLAAVH